jgi:hypothetical protein
MIVIVVIIPVVVAATITQHLSWKHVIDYLLLVLRFFWFNCILFIFQFVTQNIFYRTLVENFRRPDTH